MKEKQSSLWFALSILVIAVLACVGAIAFGLQVNSMHNDLVSISTNVAAEEGKGLAASRMRAIVRNTKDDRTALDAAIPRNIVGVLDSIERVGGQVGVTLSVGAATQDSASTTLQSVFITATADGPFQSLVRALAILESLPQPVVLESANLSMPSVSSQKNAWRLFVRLHIFTAQDSSL